MCVCVCVCVCVKIGKDTKTSVDDFIYRIICQFLSFHEEVIPISKSNVHSRSNHIFQ